MAELGLFLLIGGPIVGLLLVLIGIIQLYGDSEKAIAGRKLVLIGFLIIVIAALIGFSICSGR